MWYLLQLHARACKESECRVPRCKYVSILVLLLALDLEAGQNIQRPYLFQVHMLFLS